MIENQKKRKGLTLIEVVLTIALSALVISVIYPIFFVGVKSYDTSTNIGFAQQSARLPIDYINREIRDSKTVYVYKDLVVASDYPLYSIGMKAIDGNNYLVSEKYLSIDDTNPVEHNVSLVKDIKFIIITENDVNNILVVNENKIDVSIISIENDKNKEYNKTYESTILFSNHQIGSILIHDFDVDVNTGNVILPTDPIRTLFYTKYE